MNNPIDLKTVGERIKRLRRAQGKTQEIFADENYISASYLALLESGRRTASIDILVQIANSCHTTVDFLILGEPSSNGAFPHLYRYFEKLCESYSEKKIEKALRLAEFYLQLENEKF